jgi:hypothetical protein
MKVQNRISATRFGTNLNKHRYTHYTFTAPLSMVDACIIGNMTSNQRKEIFLGTSDDVHVHSGASCCMMRLIKMTK